MITDINIDGANNVAKEITVLGQKAIAFQADVSQSAQVNQMVEMTLKEFGKIDILVNVAGGTAQVLLDKGSPFWESTEEIWDFVINCNLKSVRNCCRAVVENMIQNKRGKIISIASLAGMRGSPARSADYSAAKGGVIALTMSLARELGSFGINVNCISPGPIESVAHEHHPEQVREKLKNMTILGRFGKPEDIANMVVFLASDEASFVTGQNIPVCGGASIGS
jgi:NAD(P)-dependent dehydrogenase (short-subunit alcohol dehydrogenase family)